MEAQAKSRNSKRTKFAFFHTSTFTRSYTEAAPLESDYAYPRESVREIRLQAQSAINGKDLRLCDEWTALRETESSVKTAPSLSAA